MDAAIGFLLVLIFLALLCLVLAIVYRNRVAVKKWLNAPYYAEDDRKLNLQRRKEDCEKELDDIKKKEAETGD